MTNNQLRMTKEIRNSNDAGNEAGAHFETFGFRHSLRHSSTLRSFATEDGSLVIGASRFRLMILWTYLALLAFCLFSPRSSHCAPTFTIQVSNVTWPGQTGSGYYVFDAAAYPYAANFTITKSKNGIHQYFVTFSRNSSG